ncbi:MAG: CARDB domain-containing protein [bacterium]
MRTRTTFLLLAFFLVIGFSSLFTNQGRGIGAALYSGLIETHIAQAAGSVTNDAGNTWTNYCYGLIEDEMCTVSPLAWENWETCNADGTITANVGWNYVGVPQGSGGWYLQLNSGDLPVSGNLGVADNHTFAGLSPNRSYNIYFDVFLGPRWNSGWWATDNFPGGAAYRNHLNTGPCVSSPTGSISSLTNPCQIASGQTTCTPLFNWNTANTNGTVVTNIVGSAPYADETAYTWYIPANGSGGHGAALPAGNYTIKLYGQNSAGGWVLLDSKPTTVVSAPTGTLTTPSSCYIPSGQTTCTPLFDWQTAQTNGVVQLNIVNANGAQPYPTESLYVANRGTAITGTPGTALPVGTYTVKLYGQNSAGTWVLLDSKQVTIVPFPTATLSVSPTSVAYNGQATLTWSSTNATSCTAGGPWSNASAPLGGTGSTGALIANATYTLQCTGPGGTTPLQSVTVSINNRTPAGYLDSASCSALSGWVVDPDSANSIASVRIFDGPSSTGTLIGTYPTSVFRGDVTEPNTGIAGLVAGNHGFSVPTPASLLGGATHSIYAYGVDIQTGGLTNLGSSPKSITCPTPTATLSVSPTSIAYNGQATLTWSSTNATSCTAGGPWSNASAPLGGSGSTGALIANATYTLQCTGNGQTSALQSVTVGVGAAPVNGVCAATHYSCSAGTSATTVEGASTYTWSCVGLNAGTTASCSEAKPAPTATLAVSPTSVAYNGQATLTWSSTNATSCTAGGPWSNASAPLGGTGSTGALIANATYTLQCTGNGQTSALQSVTVTTSPPLSCTSLWGGAAIANGDSVTAYHTASTIYPATCAQETRACGNGVLSGSYTNQTCAVLQPDLIASTVIPNTAVAGSAVTLSATVTNRGTASTGASFSNFFQVATATNGGGTVTDLAPAVMSALAANASGATAKPYTFTTAGTYSVRACADKSSATDLGAIAESDETNNCGTWTNVVVTAAPASDLTTSAAQPTAAVVGNAVTLSATVTNRGTASTGASFSNFFQVATATNGGGTVTDLAPAVMSALAANASGATAKSYTFTAAGTYSVRACADKSSSADPGAIAESDETNNCGTWTDVVIDYPGATSALHGQGCVLPVGGGTCNLTAWWSITGLTAGETVDVSVTGPGLAIRTFKNIPADSTKLTRATRRSLLAAVLGGFGATQDSTTPFIQAVGTAGTFNLTLTRHANQSALGSFALFACPPGTTNVNEVCTGAPDLIAGATVPTAAVAGIITTLSGVITNQGGASTGTTFTSLFEINSNNNPTSFHSIEATQTYVTPALAVGGTNTATTPYSFPASGTYYVRLCADTNDSNVGTITEANALGTGETNNCGPWTPVIVTAPDLIAGGASPVSATAGASIFLSAPISNQGTADVTQNFSNFFQVAVDVNDATTITDLAPTTMTPLSKGATRLAARPYSFGAGTYYVRVCADKTSRNDGGVITESNATDASSIDTGETNNCGSWAKTVVCAAGKVYFGGSCLFTPPGCPLDTVNDAGLCCPVGQVNGGGVCVPSCTNDYVLVNNQCVPAVCSGTTSCVSGPNICGMTNPGTYDPATCTCVATPPADSLCHICTPNAACAASAANNCGSSSGTCNAAGSFCAPPADNVSCSVGAVCNPGQVGTPPNCSYPGSTGSVNGSTFAPTITLNAPARVRAGGTATLTWSATGSTQCVLTGPHLPSATVTVTGDANSNVASQQVAATILGQSVYTVRCSGLGGSVSVSRTVNLIPQVIEQ